MKLVKSILYELREPNICQILKFFIFFFDTAKIIFGQDSKSLAIGKFKKKKEFLIRIQNLENNELIQHSF